MLPHRWAAAGWVSNPDPRVSYAGRVNFIAAGTLCPEIVYFG